MKKEFREASNKLELNLENEEHIKYLTQAFNNIFEQRSFNYYIYPNRFNLVDDYIKNTLNIIISNILNNPSINDDLGKDLTMDFIYSIIKLLSVNKLSDYQELPKAIRNIFMQIGSFYYFNPGKDETNKRDKLFWEFNNEYCSEFIKINELTDIKFKKGDRVDVLINSPSKGDINEMIWVEGIIREVENNYYYILYNAFDKDNEIFYPIGLSTVRRRSEEWNWRLNLKENDKAIIFNGKNWIPCMINNREESEKNGIKKIKYQVKYYEEYGDNEIQNLKETFIYHFSNRLQKYERIKNKEQIIQEIFEEKNKIQQELDDMILYKKEDNYNIIIGKLGEFYYKFCKFLKKMEKDKILEGYLNILNDDDNSTTNPEVFYTIYIIFKSALNYLHIDFIKEKKEIFKKGYFKLIELENIDIYYMKEIKEFLRIILKDSFEDFENELKAKSLGNFYEKMNSNNLNERIEAIKELNKKIIYNKKEDLAQDLKNFNIIEKIFVLEHPSEIVKYSDNILEYMKFYDKLDENDIKLIFEFAYKKNGANEKDTKDIIIKIFEKSIDNSNEIFIEKLINEIINNNNNIPDEVEKQFIRKLSIKTETNKLKICKFFIDILIRLNDLDVSKNYFAKNIREMALKDHNLYLNLFKLYKENIENNSHCLLYYELITDLFKKDKEIGNKKIFDFNIENNDLMELMKIIENEFKKYFEESKRNKELGNIDEQNYENNIKKRLNFLYEMTLIYPDYDFAPLIKLILIDEPILPKDNKYFYEFLEKYCSKENNDINLKNPKRKKILLNFLDLIIQTSEDKANKIYTYDEIKLLIKLFYYKYFPFLELDIIHFPYNEEYKIKINSRQNREIIGTNMLQIFWNIIFKVNDEKTSKLIMNILLQIVNNERVLINKINERLNELDYQDEIDIKIINKCYKLLKIFFIETEKNLFIKIKTHFSLLKDCLIKFPLEIENEEKKYRLDKIECFYGNSSLIEIKESLSGKYNIYIDYIYPFIKKDNENIFLDNSYNHKSLKEILSEFDIINDLETNYKAQLKSYIYFTAKEKQGLIKNNELSIEFKEILDKCFDKATKGNEQMEPRHFKNFLNPDIKSLKDYFLKLREKNPDKEYLTKEDIYKYYFDRIHEGGGGGVVTELNNAGYNDYLKKQDNSLENKQVENYELFRYYLSDIQDKNNNFLEDFIYNYNNISPKIDFDLFFYIPTSKYYYEKFLNHENSLYKELNLIFKDESQNLKQLYYLIIIESFLQDIETNNIDPQNIFKNSNIQDYELTSKEYLYFGNKGNIFQKVLFFEDFVKSKEDYGANYENNYEILIKYANNLMKNKSYENDELYKNCLIKSLKIIKILYISSISIKNKEIESKESKKKSIYYFNYIDVNQKFKENFIVNIPNLFYSELFKNALIYIISNYNNKNNKIEALFKECFELFIIIISSKENRLKDLNKDEEREISNFIRDELISNSSFVIEKLFFSLKFISGLPSENLYIKFLYDIFFSIYSSTLKGITKHEVNDEYLELFTAFNEFIYNDKDFREDGEINCIIKILFNDSNEKNRKIFSDELFIKYLDIFNEHLLKIEHIMNIIVSFKEGDESLISSLYENIVKKLGAQHVNHKSDKRGEKYILFEENRSKESILKNELLFKSKEFINSYLKNAKRDENFIRGITFLFNDTESININNNGIERKKIGYVGLKNLACTCYMNSILQQLFMVHVLKYAIISLSNNSINNNILIQMQLLFANLQLSEKDYYNPSGLCLTKIFNNKPIDVHIQQDCKEFYDSVCDSLESCLKNTKYKYLINDALMGKMSDSVKCQICGYTSNKFENFCDLSLEIKDISNLKNSFFKLIEEEKVKDYFCEKCNKRLVIQKRITLSKLPNTLFLQLKRFEYENDFVNVQKIFSELSFPLKLNLRKFCTESFQDETDEIYPKKEEYYDYVLKGVVQHSGSAGGGHYISFINVNRDGIGNTMDKDEENDENNWYKFNDSNVSEFNLKYLKEETLGNFRSTKAAYLLIYERIKKSPIKIVLNNINPNQKDIVIFKEEEINKINKEYDIYNKKSKIKEEDLDKKIFYNETKNEYFKYIPYYSIRKEIPEKIYDDITKENKSKDNSQKNETFSDDFYNSFYSNIDSEDSLNKMRTENINLKYDFINVTFFVLFKKINNEDINSKLNSVKNIILEAIISNESPDIEKILKLSNTLITDKNLEIIFIKDRYKEIFNKENIYFFKLAIIGIIKNISSLRNTYKEMVQEIKRISELLVNFYINLEIKKSKDRLFDQSLLNIIANDDVLLSGLLENNFINIALNNLKNDFKANIFLIIKTILKSTSDYHNKDLFYLEENDKIKERPGLKKEHKMELRERILKEKPFLLQLLFKFDQELLIILAKILCYQEDEYDSYSIKFIKEYYKNCKCFMNEGKIIEYFNVYFNLIDIKDQSALLKMKILLGYPRLIIKPENRMDDKEIEENYFYENINLNERALEESEIPRLGEDIDKEILEKELNINYIGEQLIKNNNGDILTPIYEYKNTYICDERIIGFLTELFYYENRLRNHQNELIYRLLLQCFKDGGNINIFKYLYKLPARSIYFPNLYEELFSLLNKEYKSKLSFINNIKEYFISRINGNKLPSIPKKYIEYNPDKKSIWAFKSWIADYIPGELIKKEIQIVKQNNFIELIRVEYFTKFYPLEKLNNIYNKNSLPDLEIKIRNNENINLDNNIKGQIGILDEEEDYNIDLNDNIIKKFKEGKKVVIKYNDKDNKNEKEIKTLISYIIVNKKPFMNKFSFNIKNRQDSKEMVDNSLMTQNVKNCFISEKSYKVITYIQRKSLNSKFFESDDIAVELKTSYVNEDEFQFFFSPSKIN